jgi:hypothetical protein
MFPEFSKRKIEVMEMATSVCFLQTENGNGKVLVCLLKKETENRSSFSLVGKR